MDDEESRAMVDNLIMAMRGIATIGDYRNPYRKQLLNLARKIKLLVPMLEEIKDGSDPISGEVVRTLAPLSGALDSAMELLRFGSDGSKICLVLERDKIMKKFQEVTTQLEQALSEISFEKFHVSDEVREQVELVHAQFKRAKERVDTPDGELFSDLSSAYNITDPKAVDPAILQRLAAKLHLMTISDLKQESLALHELVNSSGGVDPGESIEKMSMLLKKIKDYVQTQNPDMGTPAKCNATPLDEINLIVPVIPDDFRCPISLELMKDPIIVATGQVIFSFRFMGSGKIMECQINFH